MREVFIMRHGMSDGNKNRIIQGRLQGFTLTPEGEHEIEQLLEKRNALSEDIEFILTSTEERCYKSAMILNKKCNIPLYSFEVYREMDPGILSGEYHDDARRKFPEYYAIWMKRGDLDGIPGAETGDCLQARALAGLFLLSLFEGKFKSGLIITHAGFMRIFVNTFYGRKRTLAIDVSNAKIHAIQTEQEYFNKRCIYHSGICDVYFFKSFERTYAIKVRKGNLSCLQQEMIRFLSFQKYIPTVYYLSNICDYYFVVMEYYDGNKVYGNVALESVRIAYKKSQLIHLEINDKFGINKNEYATLDSDIRTAVVVFNSTKVRNAILAILTEYLKANRLSEYCICFYDFHRDNYLFGELDSIWIDMENAVLAPKRYGSDAFVASFVVLEGMDWKNLRDDMEETDADNFLRGIFLRLVYGLSYFLNEGVSNNEVLLKYATATSNLLADMVNMKILSGSNAMAIQEYISLVVKKLHTKGEVSGVL